MKPRNVRFSADADRDITAVGEWTLENFGARQRAAYATLINLAIQEIASNADTPLARRRPDLGREVSVMPIARTGRPARHILVFRMHANNDIEILRLLHDSMDLPRHVQDDVQD